jgi:separase
LSEDASTALSLRRDMLIAIQHKVPALYLNDLEWPFLSEDGTVLPRTSSKSTKFNPVLSFSDSEDEEASGDGQTMDRAIETYWESIRTKYQSQILDFPTLSSSRTVGLPVNWTIISISLTHDNGTLFISRQEGGTKPTDPLIFCVPLNGRRDHGSGEDDKQLSFENAIKELESIVQSSNESTKVAINIKPNDGQARSDWWKQRNQLDVRMKELMENIEYCWLGAFKVKLA